MRRALLRTAALACALPLAACGGGGSSVPTLRATTGPVATAAPAPSAAPTAATRVAAAVTIGGAADVAAAASARRRAPRYVSPASLGVTVTASGAAAQAFDVSPGSPNCSSGSPRTCTLAIEVPTGPGNFTLKIYDAKPASGAIPGSANQLGSSTIAQTIIPNATNTLAFYVGGQVAGIGAAQSFASLPADGSARAVGLALVAYDAASNPISAGASDPYANPIALSLAEAGGAGHAHLQVNGVNVGGSATLTRSSDTVAIAYDGGGSPGYTSVLTASAAGAPPFSFRLSPLYVSGAVIAGNRATFAAAGDQSVIAATESAAPGSIAYTSYLQGCTPNATLAGGSGTGSSYTVNLTDVNAPANGSGCALTIADSLGSTIVVPVTFPTPTQDCAEAPSGTQISPTTVANGSACPIVISGSPLTIYTPSDGSHPGSGTFTASQRNSNTLGYTAISGGCSSVTFSVTSSGAGLGTTSTYTFTATAQTTANVSCNVNFSGGSQTATATVIVDPAGYATGAICPGGPFTITGDGQRDAFFGCTLTQNGANVVVNAQAAADVIPTGTPGSATAELLRGSCPGSTAALPPGTAAQYTTGGGASNAFTSQNAALPAGTYCVHIHVDNGAGNGTGLVTNWNGNYAVSEN
jgi:hypothetical protein